MDRNLAEEERVGRRRFLLILAMLAVVGFLIGSWAVKAHPLSFPAWPHATTVPAGFVKVEKVYDGDTIEARVDGKPERIRLIGVDTPETVDPRRPVQCFGKQASDHTKSLLKGQVVRLESDVARGQTGDRDKYGRLLRYIFLPDGSMLNLELIREGFGHEYTFQGQFYVHQAAFKSAEAEARQSQRGLWAPDTCNGDTKKAAS